MLKYCLVTLALVGLVLPARADSTAAPVPYVAASEDGQYYFKMVPDLGLDLDKGMGYAYQVTDLKTDKLLWQVSGWYAFETFLSCDGEYLVRLGNWPEGSKPSESHLAIAFYKDGKEIKSYSTAEIIKDKSKVEPSVSHYQFYQGKPGFTSRCSNNFKLTSIDGVEYIFDIRTGETASAKALSCLDLLRSSDVSLILAGIDSLDEEALRNEDVAEQLVFLLNDERIVRSHFMGSETVQDRARFALRTLDSTLVSFLTRHLPDLKSDHAKGLLLEAIAEMGKPNAEAYRTVLPYCQHENVSVRLRAIPALSAVGERNREVVTKLGHFLDDEEPIVRWTVLECLNDRPQVCQHLVPEIGRLLDDNSEVPLAISNHFFTQSKLKGRTARLLAAIGPDAVGTLPQLKELLKAEDFEVRVWSATAVCAIEDPPPPETLRLLGEMLLKDLDQDRLNSAAPIDGIAQLGPRAAPLLEMVERAKAHKSGLVRCGVVKAFFAIHPESAVARVLPMVHDEDEWVVQSVIENLSAHGYDEKPVIDVYVDALAKHDGLFDQPASAAVEALTKLGATARPAIPALERLAHDPDASDRIREDARRAITAIER